jgi:hypothetical protein
MTVKEDTRRSKLNISSPHQLSSFDREIRNFDVTMDLIQEHMPEDLKVWDRIAVVRDAVFKLQQQLRGVEIEVFAEPWIEPLDDKKHDNSSSSLLEDE